MRLIIAFIAVSCTLGGVAQAKHKHHSSDPEPQPVPPATTTPSPAPATATVTPPPTTPAISPAAAPTVIVTPAPTAYVPVPAPVIVVAPPTVVPATATTTAVDAAAASAATLAGFVEPSECTLAPQVSAVDPIRSGPVPGAAPELVPPVLDILGASLQYNANGPAVDTVFAPAASGVSRHIPVISDMRVRIYGRDNGQRWGALLGLGYDSASHKLVDKSDKIAGPCTPAAERALQQARFDRAYRKRVVVHLRGGADMLPFLAGPKVLDTTTNAFVDPQSERFGGYNVALSIAYFHNRAFGLWLTGGFAGVRSVAGTSGVTKRGGAGLDIAYKLGIGQLRPDGFQPGITFGGDVRLSKCVESRGCDADVHGYSTPVEFDLLIGATPFIDLSLYSWLQLRLAAPINYYALKSAPANTLGGSNITEVSPTLSLHIAGWGF